MGSLDLNTFLLTVGVGLPIGLMLFKFGMNGLKRWAEQCFRNLESKVESCDSDIAALSRKVDGVREALGGFGERIASLESWRDQQK